MATVRSLTADRMLAIEAASVVDGDVVGDNLILKKQNGSTINAGNVRGPAGYGAETDQGMASFISGGTATPAALSVREANVLDPKTRRIGLLKNCVIVGSSNATAPSWSTEFCAAWGLTQRNFAIAGTAFTGTNNFQTQLTTAANNSGFQNNDVGMVIICDASNSIRAKTATILTEVNACFAYAKATFPNARIICVPVIWPADPETQVTGVPGGWQITWHEVLRAQADQIRTAARKHTVEVVDESWTWLTGLSGVMESTGGVHPNAAGYTLIAEWISSYLRGGKTRRDTPWVDVPYPSGVVVQPGARKIQVMREGWTVYVTGSAKMTVTSPTYYTDLGTIPIGFRPLYSEELPLRKSTTEPTTLSSAQVFQSGPIRVWRQLAAEEIFQLTGTYTIG